MKLFKGSCGVELRSGAIPLTQWDHRYIMVVSIDISLLVQKRSQLSVGWSLSLVVSDTLIYAPAHRGPDKLASVALYVVCKVAGVGK